MNIDNINIVFDLFSLFSAKMNGTECKGADSFDYTQIYTLAKSHSVASAAYLASLPYIADKPEYKELLAIWKHDYKESLYKSIQFEAESSAISKYLSSIGCRHMLLKGPIIKNYYPDPAMREFIDNDIFYDDAFFNQLDSFMHSIGYKTDVVLDKNISYKKLPFYYFEMHNSLIDKKDNARIWEYYCDVMQRLVPAGDNEYLLSFTDEDFYIYMCVHAFIHYSKYGTGLKNLLDIFVYLKNKASSLNYDYISAELSKLALDEFEATLRSLAMKMMNSPKTHALTEKEQNMLCYLSRSGTFGIWDNYVSNKLSTDYSDNAMTACSKINYFLKRFFPDKNVMKQSFSFIDKYPFLLVFGYIYRLFVKGVKGRKRLLRELKIVIKK